MRDRLGDERRTSARSGRAIKRRFDEIIDPLPDTEFPKTFFSSVTRRTFGTVGVDAGHRVHRARPGSPRQRDDARRDRALRRTAALSSCWSRNCSPISASARPYRDFDRSVQHGRRRGQGARSSATGERRTIESIEVIKEVFYQMTRAYLVGRIRGRGWIAAAASSPCATPRAACWSTRSCSMRADGERRCSASRARTSTSISRASAKWSCSWAKCCRASRSASSTRCSAAPSRARPSATGSCSAICSIPTTSSRSRPARRPGDGRASPCRRSTSCSS